MLFEFDRQKVIIDDRIKNVPEIKELSKTKDGKDILTYIALMYDINSPYNNVLPEERERMLKKDVFGEENPKCLKQKNVLTCIEKVEFLTLSPEMRLYEILKKKVEQAIGVITNREINEENIDSFLKDMKNLKELQLLKNAIMESETLSKKKGKKRGGRELSELENYTPEDKD